MDPSEICEELLSFVRRSNLNFSISESPFGVSIKIKKTYFKDLNGVERLPVRCEFPKNSYVKSEGQTTSARGIKQTFSVNAYK